MQLLTLEFKLLAKDFSRVAELASLQVKSQDYSDKRERICDASEVVSDRPGVLRPVLLAEARGNPQEERVQSKPANNPEPEVASSVVPLADSRRLPVYPNRYTLPSRTKRESSSARRSER